MLSRIARTVALLSLALLSFACHPNVDITFENRTSNDVFVEVNDSGFEKIKAGAERTISFLIDGDEDFRVRAKTMDERVVYDQTFTREELEQMDNRVVISDAESRAGAPPSIAQDKRIGDMI